jgi:hypothetical protein
MRDNGHNQTEIYTVLNIRDTANAKEIHVQLVAKTWQIGGGSPFNTAYY